MIDLLDKINKNEITIDQAYDIFDGVVDKFHKGILKDDIFDYLCMDRYERTARAHALSLLTLAKWRKDGWPKQCSRCGAEIDYKKFGWTIKDDKLVGLYCCSKDDK